MRSSSASCLLLLLLQLLEPYCLIGVMLWRGLDLGNRVQTGLGDVIERYRGGEVQGTGEGRFRRGLGGGVLGTCVGKNL